MKDEMSRIIPQRIVPLACSNTEILFARGLGSIVVGVDDWSDFPPPVGDLPRVGPDKRVFHFATWPHRGMMAVIHE